MLSELLMHRRVRSVCQPLEHRASGDLIGYEALARGMTAHAARAAARVSDEDLQIQRADEGGPPGRRRATRGSGAGPAGFSVGQRDMSRESSPRER